jgi:phosphoribosylanthranilate isomerase
MSFVIKICGLTSPDDVKAAVGAGATAIGINLWRGSKRFAGSQASRVAAAVPANVWRVGVFVNATADEVVRQARALDLTHVQLHGDEAPRDFAGLGWPIVRAVRVKDVTSLAELALWPAATLLLDAYAEGYGGAGAVAPWEVIAAGVPRERPFLLAGGLTAENVAAAIARTRPAGVDVASGVESAPGTKSPAKMEAFVRAATEAARALSAPGGVTRRPSVRVP